MISELELREDFHPSTTTGEPGQVPLSELGGTGREQQLLEAFLGSRCRTRGPLIAISERTMITNAGASELLLPPDRRMFWQWAQDVIRDNRDAERRFALSSGLVVQVRCRPVGDGGAILHLSLESRSCKHGAGSKGKSEQTQQGYSFDPSLATGWIELTDSERTVAELVARGLTNKETGREMFISHHTVDCHLRQVFRKLGVNSRVELARMVGEHYETLIAR